MCKIGRKRSFLTSLAWICQVRNTVNHLYFIQFLLRVCVSTSISLYFQSRRQCFHSEWGQVKRCTARKMFKVQTQPKWLAVLYFLQFSLEKPAQTLGCLHSTLPSLPFGLEKVNYKTHSIKYFLEDYCRLLFSMENGYLYEFYFSLKLRMCLLVCLLSIGCRRYPRCL